MEKELPVECFVDEEKVDCKELQETEQEYYESYTTGRGSDA